MRAVIDEIDAQIEAEAKPQAEGGERAPEEAATPEFERARDHQRRWERRRARLATD